MVLKSAFKKTTMLIGLQFLVITSLFGQLATSFSGELIYTIKKIDVNNLQSGFGNDNPNTEEKLIIYAKDSLIKRVHFNSENGIQVIFHAICSCHGWYAVSFKLIFK